MYAAAEPKIVGFTLRTPSPSSSPSPQALAVHLLLRTPPQLKRHHGRPVGIADVRQGPSVAIQQLALPIHITKIRTSSVIAFSILIFTTIRYVVFKERRSRAVPADVDGAAVARYRVGAIGFGRTT